MSEVTDDSLESEAGLEPHSEEIYPDAVIKVSRDQYSTFEIKRMIEETEELILAPEFQRNSVWKIEQKRELIESLLMGIPIPVIYVFENEQGIKQMVDGRQRTSISSGLPPSRAIAQRLPSLVANGRARRVSRAPLVVLMLLLELLLFA